MKIALRTTASCKLVGSKEKEYEKNKFSYSLAIVSDGEVANIPCNKTAYEESLALMDRKVILCGDFDATYKNFKALCIMEDVPK